MFVCCECCVLSGIGLCDGLITRPESSYRLWCVVVCDLEDLKNEAIARDWAASTIEKKNKTCLRTYWKRRVKTSTTGDQGSIQLRLRTRRLARLSKLGLISHAVVMNIPYIPRPGLTAYLHMSENQPNDREPRRTPINQGTHCQ